MKMKLIFFAMMLISVFSSPALLDHMKLVLTWPGTYCESDFLCRRQWVNSWDKRSFVIHGLWPSSINNAADDDFCQISYRFNDRDIPNSLKSQLNSSMPDLRYGQSGLWKYQFQKHGSCYIAVMKNKGSNLSEKDLMIKYFQTIVRLYNDLVPKIKLRKSTFTGSEDLASAFGLRPNQMQISSNNGELKQVRICYSLPLRGIPGTQILTACPRYKAFKSKLNLPDIQLNHHLHL